MSFVKDFELEEIENYVKDEKTVEVFWSPNAEETSATLLNKQGKILTIDKKPESGKKSSGPLPGYYFAKILMVAGKFLFSNFTGKGMQDTAGYSVVFGHKFFCKSAVCSASNV